MFFKPGVPLVCCVLFFSFPAAAAGPSGESGMAVQEIIAQWTAVQRSFLTGAGAGSQPGRAGLIEEIDSFYFSVESFLASRIYRMYRYIPFSRGEDSAVSFGSRPRPNEFTELESLKDLILSFKKAVLADNRDTALVLMMDIHESLVHWQRLDLEAEKFISTAYFELFLVFTVFIAAMVLAVWFLYRALKRSWNQEKAGAVFSRALVLAQEEERSRIAGELHDTVAQDLRYLALRMGKIVRTADGAERESLCREVIGAQESLIGRVRNICDGLFPPDFRFQGLPDALRRLCYDFGRRTGLDCRIDVEENLSLKPMNEDMQLQAFRIVQEALTNVEKHAGAGEAVVVLRNSLGDREKSRGVFISVSDDGKGFRWTSRYVRFDSPPSIEVLEILNGKLLNEGAPGHLGIRGMYERCAILGGSLVIESEEGEGTTVCLEIPLELQDG
jgi:signal transduction histidine kinase